MTTIWQQLELAGFDLADLRLPGLLVVPHGVELRDDRIFYRLFGGVVERVDGVTVVASPTLPRVVRPTSDLLEQFVRIDDAKGVLRFADRWGVFGFCEAHGLPWTHRAQPAHIPFNDRDSMNADLRRLCYPSGWFEQETSEPIDSWMAYVRRAVAMLTIATALRQRQRPKHRDWLALYGDTGNYDVGRDPVSLIEHAIRQWLVLSDTRPLPTFDKKLKPRVVFATSLLSAITLQIVAAIGSSPGAAVCSGCQETYFPSKRGAKFGQRHYCQKCRAAGVPQRHAAADYRRRRRRKSRRRSAKEQP